MNKNHELCVILFEIDTRIEEVSTWIENNLDHENQNFFMHKITELEALISLKKEVERLKHSLEYCKK